MATHYIPSSYLPRIKQQLQQAGVAASDLSAVNAILTDLEQAALKEQGGPPPSSADSSLLRLQPLINRCFSHHTVQAVVAALQAEKAERPWCEETLQQLQR